MATQVAEKTPEQEASDAAASPPKSGARMGALPIMIVVGLLAGGGLGAFATGPMLAKRLAAPAAPAKKADEGTHPLHSIDNLVLNPAGTGGTRFLMVNATLQLRDAAAEQLVKDREAEVRDRIIDLLGKKTIDELSDIGRRDAIKRQVLAAVAPMFPRGVVMKVFFPQFVIQ